MGFPGLRSVGRVRARLPSIPYVSPGLGIAAFLVVYNNLINLLPQPLHNQIFIPLNLAVAVLLVLWARSLGFSWQALGLSLNRISAAFRWGLGVGVAIPAPLFIAMALPEPIGSLADARDFSEVSPATLAYQTLLRIPLGTALFEEVAFRGVLFGVLAQEAGVRRAAVWSSVAFGLWHVTPTIELMRLIEWLSAPYVMAFAVLGGVAATSVGGLFFVWLRLRSGSVYGPILTHWSINSLSAFAAALSGR